MVQIPTAADMQRSSVRSGRLATQGPSVSVGAGLANLGQGLVQAAYSLSDLATQERADNLNKRSNDVSTGLARFVADEEERFLTAREAASESGIGFTRQFMEEHQKRANEFAKSNFGGLNDDAQTGYLNTILARSNDLFAKANTHESIVKAKYYDRTTNQTLDGFRTQIRSNAADFETVRNQGLEQINTAAMPEEWKAERRAMWDADAAESRWRWEYEQNPVAAIQQARGPSTAKALLRDEEGFRPEPYWDVNAWRIGYGSDTITRPDGTQEAVRPGMKITREDAERDLDYRLSSREGARAREQIGEQWASLPSGTQAALDSVAYNYGSLPPSVVKAVKSGDNEAVAVAVESLSSNPARRKREAGVIRGTITLKPEDSYESIPYERRQQLAEWGESQYNQAQVQQRAATVDNYKLMIATEPHKLTTAGILADTMLDNGDKATLITSLNTANKENAGVNDFIAALSGGRATVNPFDNDQTNIADKAFGKMYGAAATPEEQAAVTSGFVSASGYVPKPVQARLRQGAASTDPGVVAGTMEAGMSYSTAAPSSFNFEGASGIRDKMDVYRAMTQVMGYSPTEAAQKIIDSSDPQKVAERKALMESDKVKKAIKAIDPGTVSRLFDDSVMGFGRNPSLGTNPAAEAAIVAEYRAIYEETIVDAGGDPDIAKVAAAERLRRVYGTSEFSTLGNTVIRYPVEKAYPAGPDGTHDYVRKQAIEALGGEGVSTDEIFLMPLPDGGTARDIQSGVPARYQIFYKDPETGNVEQFNLPFYVDKETASKQFDAQRLGRVQDAERRMIDGRADTMENDKIVGEALEETVGPDWMKARAAESGMEKKRMMDAEREASERRAPKMGGGW